MDLYMQKNKKRAKVICDNYDQCKGFSTLDFYGLVRENGHFNNLSAPQFLDSNDEILIQVADVVAYFTGQKIYQIHCDKNNVEYKKDFKAKFYRRCADKYLKPFDRGSLVPYKEQPDYMIELRSMMLMELALKRISPSSPLFQSMQDQIDSKTARLFPK